MKAKRTLALLLCMVLLVAGSVFGTYAYLTSTDSVANTFTVGNVAITLDEADIDDSTADADRDKANAYHLLPGTDVSKDPTVHVVANSEECYVFVKVINNLAGIESDDEGDTTIAAQMEANDWIELEGKDNVYVYNTTVAKSATVTDLVVFENVYIDEDVSNATLATYEGKTIEVTAYAIQAAGFGSASEAWTAGGWA